MCMCVILPYDGLAHHPWCILPVSSIPSAMVFVVKFCYCSLNLTSELAWLLGVMDQWLRFGGSDCMVVQFCVCCRWGPSESLNCSSQKLGWTLSIKCLNKCISNDPPQESLIYFFFLQFSHSCSVTALSTLHNSMLLSTKAILNNINSF